MGGPPESVGPSSVEDGFPDSVRSPPGVLISLRFESIVQTAYNLRDDKSANGLCLGGCSPGPRCFLADPVSPDLVAPRETMAFPRDC